MKELIDKGKFVCGIFVDLRKGFDTDDILLLELEHGIRDNMLNWFKSCLSNRKQYVLQRAMCLSLYYFYYTSMIFRISLKY